MDDEIVWLLAPWSVYAIVVSRGAHYSVVDIPGEGRVAVENDDFEEWEERVIDFEQE